MSISKNSFRITTKAKTSHNLKKPTKDEEDSISSEESFNIWKPSSSKKPSIILPNSEGFLQLYKRRYEKFSIEKKTEKPEKIEIMEKTEKTKKPEKSENLKIVQNVYKLCGEKTFKINDWREFADHQEKREIPSFMKKRPDKLSILGWRNSVKKVEICQISEENSMKSPLKTGEKLQKTVKFEIKSAPLVKKGLKLPLMSPKFKLKRK